MRGIQMALGVVVACMGCCGERVRPTSEPVVGEAVVGEVRVFDTAVRWGAPSSSKPMRMSSDPSVVEPAAFGALWDTRTGNRMGQRMVVLSMADESTFGAGVWVWDVAVVDAKGQIVQKGKVRCTTEELPYCLLEIKTGNPKLPGEYRNRWTLAVGLVYVEGLMRFDVGQGFHFVTGEAALRDGMNNIDVEPVEWEGEKFTKFEAGNLDEWPCICRPGERVLQRVMHEGAVARE